MDSGSRLGENEKKCEIIFYKIAFLAISLTVSSLIFQYILRMDRVKYYVKNITVLLTLIRDSFNFE